MNHHRTSGRRVVAGLTLTATLSALGAVAPAQAAGPQPALPHQVAGISFAADVPSVKGALPLYRLVHGPAPTKFLSEILGDSGKLAPEGSLLVARDARGVMHGFADGSTGEAQLFPDLAEGSGRARPAEYLARFAARVFSRPDVIPKDATVVRFGTPAPIFAQGAQMNPTGGPTTGKAAPTLLFTYFPASRYIAGLPVEGQGSHVTVGIGNDGSIRAFVHKWNGALADGSVMPTANVDQVEREIAAQLVRFRPRYGAIRVDSITPAYYDGNAKFIQPVYEFVATLGADTRGTLQDHVRGYVPVGRLAEPLPVIGADAAGPAPSAPAPAQTNARHAMGNPSRITLGQYVNRACTGGPPNCLDMANAYVNGFDNPFAAISGFAPIVRTQYYWAYSFEVLGAANSYLNAVNVAYTNPHGDWWLNTTIGNYVPTGDPWTVNQIGTGGNPGYGAAAGGQLATWIIDSCEIIPSYYDLQYSTGNGWTAFNNWWPVFQGLHRALGFRTQMLLGEDSMNYEIAFLMSLGAPAESAFYNEVAAQGSFPTYVDTHLNLTVQYDRVSTMSDGRNLSESIYSVQGQSAATELVNHWMGN